jgi:hypothetical protein
MRYQSPIFKFYETEYTPLLHTYDSQTFEIKVCCEDYIKAGALKGQHESSDYIWFDINGDWVICQLNNAIRFPLKDYPELEHMVMEYA